MRIPIVSIVSLTAALAANLPATAQGQAVFEDFEDLSPGQLDGQGEWHGWDGTNTPFATVVSTHNHTPGGQRSVELVSGADSVRELDGFTAGRHELTAWVYVPTGFTGYAAFVVLNGYQDGGPYEWASQLRFEGQTGQMECDCGAPTSVDRPLVYDTWVDLRLDIDLAGDTVDVYYDTASEPTPIATYAWSGGTFGTDSFPVLRVDAIDLFSSSSEIYFDDIGIGPTIHGAGVYQITGSSTGAGWSTRISQGSSPPTVVVSTFPGLSAGADADAIAEEFIAEINAIGASFTPPISAFDTGFGRFKVAYTGTPFVFEVGDASATSFCTIASSSPCAFNPTIELIEENPVEPGQSICFCDGGGAAPCGNTGGVGAGCANSAGAEARLHGAGSDSVAAGDLVLAGEGLLPGQPCLFFQGLDLVDGGAGVPFGDGRRCCGGGVVRLETAVPDAAGEVASSVDLPGAGGVAPGDLRCYQLWYRDPGGPCGSTFNLTNAFVVTWSP